MGCIARGDDDALTTASPLRARRNSRSLSSSLRGHRVEEFLVRLRALHARQQELHRVDDVQRVQQLPQDPHAVYDGLTEEELFLARARLVDVEAREDALLHQLAVED